MSIIITPFIITIALINDFETIKYRKYLIYNQRYGSLFEEFKNDRFLSQIAYYPILTLTSLIYSTNQIFLSEFELLQKLINLLTSLVFFIYLIKYRPFTETWVMITELFSELSIIFLFLIILLKGFKYDHIFNISFISCVIIQIGFQYLISFIMFLKYIRSKYIQYKSRKSITN